MTLNVASHGSKAKGTLVNLVNLRTMPEINPTEAALLAQKHLELTGTPHAIAQATARIIYKQVNRRNEQDKNEQSNQHQDGRTA